MIYKRDCILPDPEQRHGPWEPKEEYQDRLYKIYVDSIIKSQPQFMDVPVLARDTDPKQAYDAFWHLVTKTEDYSGNRWFSDERGERIPWIAGLITGLIDCCDIKVFKRYSEKTKRDRIYIWCEQLSYVVILENRDTYFFLITAYIVDDKTRKQFTSYYKKDRYIAFDVYLQKTKTPS